MKRMEGGLSMVNVVGFMALAQFTRSSEVALSLELIQSLSNTDPSKALTRTLQLQPDSLLRSMMS